MASIFYLYITLLCTCLIVGTAAQCAAGKYFRDGSQCVDCPPGKSSQRGAKQCTTSCPLNYYVDGDCPAGSYISIAQGSGRSTLHPTPAPATAPGSPGSEPVVNRCGQCLYCPQGSFSTAVNSYKCTRCPQSGYADKVGSTSCKECPVNTIFVVGANDHSHGSYNPPQWYDYPTFDSRGYTRYGWYPTYDGSCSACPDKTKRKKGECGCNYCKKGYFLSYDPSRSTWGLPCTCEPCAGLTYADTDGASSCRTCPAGHYVVQTPYGRSNFLNVGCKACPSGSYSPAQSSRQCDTCEPGSYSTSGATQCVSCPAGKYTDRGGAGKCTACLAGKYTGFTGQTVCDNCQQGKYSSADGSTQCINCPPGTYGRDIGRSSDTTCMKCPAGTFSLLPGSVDCQACPLTTTSPEGSSVCHDANGAVVHGSVQTQSGRDTAMIWAIVLLSLAVCCLLRKVSKQRQDGSDDANSRDSYGQVQMEDVSETRRSINPLVSSAMDTSISEA